ncbi:catenin alpha-1, partial [Plakobranchus ocellatus]
MDVSQGLIAKLVKCKSIKHALTPISSQVSLLIIIVEQQDGSSLSQVKSDLLAGAAVLDVTACTTQLGEAVSHLVRAGERQSRASKDEDFITQMSSACESLTVACNQLSILAQRFSSSHTPSRGSKDSLCQAAKDVLQGVLKIFLVIDDFHVRQIVSKIDFVLRNVEDVLGASKSELVQVFKSLTFSVLALKTELKKRCSNLLSRACADQLLVWLGVLQNSVPSLSIATQTKLKYQDNLAAKASEESVEHDIKEACKKIRQLLLTGPQDEVDDELVSFVGLVDNIMDNLSELNRSNLSPSLDSNIVALVQHSMGVAHLASGSHRDLVVACCHRILQAKFRLFDLDASLKDGQLQNAIRVDYDNTCETLLDEVCDLEKQVNMTLLQLIIHTFLCPEDELRPLRNIARNKRSVEGEDNVQVINKFTEYSENLCQVSLLVAASSTDASKVREIVTSVRSLESIEADVGPAVLLTAANQGDQSSHQHLELTLDRWLREVRAVLTAVDTMVDPRVFMDMTESIMEEELESLRDVVGRSHEELCARFYHLRHLAQRPVQMARRLQDESCDAIYRNGLGVFIQLLVQRIAEATEAFQEIVTQASEARSRGGAQLPPAPRQVDTLHRRLSLTKKAVGTLREGLNIRHHPSLMSEHRRMLFAHRPVEMVHEHIKLKKEKEDNKMREQEAKTEELKKRKKEEKKNESEGSENMKEKESIRVVTAAPARVMSLPKPDKENVEHHLRFPPEFDNKEQEGGSAAEIYKQVRRLVSACMQQQTRSVEELTHGILSWTNHIVENADMLLAHCPNVARKEELKTLVKEADKLAPLVIQQARFVCAGDTQTVYKLVTDGARWAAMLNGSRVIVDVAADRWLVLTSDLRQLIQGHDQHKLKLAVSAVTNAQKEMTGLLLKTRFLNGTYLPDGQREIQFLTDSHADIENLAITIKTAVDVAGLSDSQHDQTWWQLGISCRDWSVLMTCVTAELDSIADTMAGLALLRMPRLAPLSGGEEGGSRSGGGGQDVKGLRLADVVERETDSLLELVDCVVAGDTTLKARSESLVFELQAALTDIFSLARQPVTLNETPLHALLCRLRIGLAKSRWIERALDIQDLIRNSCCQYMGFARTLLLDAQDLSIKEEAAGSVKVSDARHKVSKQFLEKSAALKQRTLRAIQLCPELSRRAVVRSTLDGLAKLTTEIGDVMRAPGRIPDAKVSSLTEQWGARIKKLLASLGKMDGVKPQVVS